MCISSGPTESVEPTADPLLRSTSGGHSEVLPPLHCPCLRRLLALPLGRPAKAMKILPRSKDEWIALALYPFKAYVVMALPFLDICRWLKATDQPRFYGYLTPAADRQRLHQTCN
jgi:hypothetical protein